jgi:hypothetical protein
MIKTNEDYKIKIKHGNTLIEADRLDLINVDQTYDGVVFSFKNGLQFQYVNNDMELRVKELIISSTNIPKGNIEIDLNNHRNPTKVTL